MPRQRVRRLYRVCICPALSCFAILVSLSPAPYRTATCFHQSPPPQMEEGSFRKRSFIEEPDSDKAPPQKKVRFPKGKKLKAGIEPLGVNISTASEDEGRSEAGKAKDLSDPRHAAKERARRRSQMIAQLDIDEDDNLGNISAAEVRYKHNDVFEDDGIQFEPFNLEKEREEGYFDAAGNFVEYVADKEEKDAWLDNAQVDPKLAEKVSKGKNQVNEEVTEAKELSSGDIAQMKRRIGDALEPDETVLQALRRLKGSSNKKEKMSAETKLIFDQLTEDAMKLMENGDYNVYHEKKEVFEREAEGYESLVQARKNGLSTNDSFDMFGDADADADVTANLSCAQTNSASVGDETADKSAAGSSDGQSEYVYDESSGYYYSSSLGYYYDPSTQLYCSAATGKWYLYNEEKGTYDEVQPEAPS